MIDSFAELTLETRDVAARKRFYRYLDPARNVVAVSGVFRRGDGAREGVEALR
jgi:hypothetical protein